MRFSAAVLGFLFAAGCAMLQPRRAAEPRRGAELYARMCAVCHGVNGEGFAADKAPSLSNPDFLAAADDQFLTRGIDDGRKGTTMSVWGAKNGGPLTPSDTRDLIAFMRTWSGANRPPVKPAAKPSRPPALPLGPVPLNPKGREPEGFHAYPAMTSVETVKRNLDKHAKMAILDARAPTDYAVEHIAGAVSVPFYDPSPYLTKLPKDAWLVCYCGCPHAESGKLAEALITAGFMDVTVLDEGFGVWKSSNFPTTKGPLP